MFEELQVVLENGMLNKAGAIPVVFEGIEHTLSKKTPVANSSSHTSHELLYLRSGKCEFTIEGKKFMLDKGSTLIIRPNIAHKVRIPSDQVEMFVVYFGFSTDIESIGSILSSPVLNIKAGATDTETPHSGPSIKVPKSFAQTSLESFIDFVSGTETDNKLEPYIILSGKYKAGISNIVEKIVYENSRNNYAKGLMMQLLTLEMMVTLSRAIREEWEESLRVKNGKARELVFIAKKYMDQNFDSGISVADAASYVFLSQGYFTRAFREEMDVSPMQYLMSKRINYACELLSDDEVKIYGIAVKAGFSSPQRFNVAFRKQMGMTPMEYRHKLRNKSNRKEE